MLIDLYEIVYLNFDANQCIRCHDSFHFLSEETEAH